MNEIAESKVWAHGLDDSMYTKQIHVVSCVLPFTGHAENGIVLIMT